ncbi:uracil-DNA glycosylase [Kiritimatiellota bacterium B12222]|nr:uracil-DNA glycosylase [Kiritimatiellota bacterium B12222]
MSRDTKTNLLRPESESGWVDVLSDAFANQGFAQLQEFLAEEEARGQTVYPPSEDIFSAMNLTPWEKVRVVILGQDPYHGPGQANGLSFSVAKGVPLPPSLRNIYKELADDLQLGIPESGDLRGWAEQGVLLLNATLTVRAHEAGSHQKKGWETFTDEVIDRLNDHPRRLVFILWGSYARKKAAVINRERHVVIESAHPSPLSAYRGFFGSKPFSQTNTQLQEWGEEEVQWGTHRPPSKQTQAELF